MVCSLETVMSGKLAFQLSSLRLAVALGESLVLPVVFELSTVCGMLIVCWPLVVMVTSFEGLPVALSPLG